MCIKHHYPLSTDRSGTLPERSDTKRFSCLSQVPQDITFARTQGLPAPVLTSSAKACLRLQECATTCGPKWALVLLKPGHHAVRQPLFSQHLVNGPCLDDHLTGRVGRSRTIGSPLHFLSEFHLKKQMTNYWDVKAVWRELRYGCTGSSAIFTSVSRLSVLGYVPVSTCPL